MYLENKQKINCRLHSMLYAIGIEVLSNLYGHSSDENS